MFRLGMGLLTFLAILATGCASSCLMPMPASYASAHLIHTDTCGCVQETCCLSDATHPYNAQQPAHVAQTFQPSLLRILDTQPAFLLPYPPMDDTAFYQEIRLSSASHSNPQALLRVFLI